MKIAVSGSRDYPQLKDVHYWLPKLFDAKKDVMLSGGARGVDKEAEKVAVFMEMPIVFYLPNRKSVKSDYIKRNMEMVDDADFVVVFWDGVSPGSKSVVDYSRKKHKKLFVITSNGKTGGKI